MFKPSKFLSTLGCDGKGNWTSDTASVTGKTTEQNYMLKLYRLISEVLSLSTLRSQEERSWETLI